MLISNAIVKRWTSDEYYRLYDTGFFTPDERMELIEGELVLMAPPNPEHSEPIRRGTMFLVRLYGETHDVAVQLPLDLATTSVPQPDFALIARGTVVKGKNPTMADLVIEVSNSSLTFDRNEKASLYAKAGIPEYWIVDVVHQRVEVYRQPGLSSGVSEPFVYSDCQILEPEQSVQPLKVPGTPCPLARFFE